MKLNPSSMFSSVKKGYWAKSLGLPLLVFRRYAPPKVSEGCQVVDVSELEGDSYEGDDGS
jgi:hypothetical protein